MYIIYYTHNYVCFELFCVTCKRGEERWENGEVGKVRGVEWREEEGGEWKSRRIGRRRGNKTLIAST